MIAGWQEKIDAAQWQTTVMIDGVELARQPYGGEFPGQTLKPRCHDCATELGDLHVPHCSVERCPACGEQAISCGCDED
jgi:hypothetical protein